MVTSLVTAVPLASAASETEPNDSFENAQPISVGETITGSTPTEADKDWFRFQADAGETINVTASVPAGDDPDKISLHSRDGGKIVETRVTGGETNSIGTTATYTGPYYVQMDYDFGDPSDYSFTVDTYETDDFEPNESPENATRISPNATLSGETTIGDDDWFRFEAEAGETINMTASVPTGDDPDKIRLYTAGGASRGNWFTETRVAGGETKSIGFTARYTGTYYARMEYDFGAPTDYTFTLETYRTDAFEPNENRSLATQLYDNPFTPAAAQVSIGDNDYFKYRLETGETLRVEAGVNPAVRNHRLWLYRPGDDRDDPTNATEVDGGTIGVAELTAQSTDVHHLVIWGGRGGDTGGYNVTITAGGETVGPPNDRFETANPPVGNQDRQHATPIDSGRYENLGMVEDDEDWFRIRAAQDARVTVNTSYDASVNDLSVTLRSADGTTVASGGDNLATNVSAAGTYYLQVTGNDSAQATYALAVNVSAAGPGAFPGQTAAPTDVDGDGRYEDVNGDGDLNVIDVSILLGAFDRVSAGEVPFYDFTDDGQLNVLDVAALLDQT